MNRRFYPLLAAAACCSALLAQSTASSADFGIVGDAPATSTSLEAQPAGILSIFALTNQARVTQGLAALTWSPALATAGLAHARRMASSRTLSHRYPDEPDLPSRAASAGAHFSAIAENIATGYSPQQVASAWMASTPHRTNILDPRMNSIGVALVQAGGRLFAVQDFAAALPSLSPETVEQKVEQELVSLAKSVAPEWARPLFVDVSHITEARRICAEGSAVGAAKVPYWTAPYTVIWQSPTLNLPPALADALRKGQYHTAVVGACAGSEGAFTSYRVAVVLD